MQNIFENRDIVKTILDNLSTMEVSNFLITFPILLKDNNIHNFNCNILFEYYTRRFVHHKSKCLCDEYTISNKKCFMCNNYICQTCILTEGDLSCHFQCDHLKRRIFNFIPEKYIFNKNHVNLFMCFRHKKFKEYNCSCKKYYTKLHISDITQNYPDQTKLFDEYLNWYIENEISFEDGYK